MAVNLRDKGVNPVYFILCLLMLALWVNVSAIRAGHKTLVMFLPFFAGLTAFLFQSLCDKKPILWLYSKSYPYRKLKAYGWISSFLMFEFILVWGMHTGQISFNGWDPVIINVLLAGAIIHYHLFVRMKISLRFLFLGIFVPLAATGLTLGLGSYFKVLTFVLPGDKIGNIVFTNSMYWVIVSIFFQAVCEEPAFRGYLMQKFLYKTEAHAIIISSVCYALWRTSFSLFDGNGMDEIIILFIGNFITGSIFAVLFLKSRNLLAPIICHGIVNGIWRSFFAFENNPGIGQYIEFVSPKAIFQFTILWYACLLIGLLLLLSIPRKKIFT
ncbi:MAG: CPBP family intramembrane metalloprotease [Candidatus Omnitrophica bacterium]|nr:CPBP family intramembrane metalloprotease [Candidatus Omnitrophota bacterium]